MATIWEIGGPEIGGVRNEFERVRRYTEVLWVGLVAMPADYLGSSANAGSKAVVAG
jgi:hypothetical protein